MRLGLPRTLLPQEDAPLQRAETHLLQDYGYTYLERDVADLSRLDGLMPFRKFQRLAALRSGGLLNNSELARVGRSTRSWKPRPVSSASRSNPASKTVASRDTTALREIASALGACWRGEPVVYRGDTLEGVGEPSIRSVPGRRLFA